MNGEVNLTMLRGIERPGNSFLDGPVPFGAGHGWVPHVHFAEGKSLLNETERVC